LKDVFHSAHQNRNISAVFGPAATAAAKVIDIIEG
jgi:hypothetical protein